MVCVTSYHVQSALFWHSGVPLSEFQSSNSRYKQLRLAQRIGARQELTQVLQWGDPAETLRFLAARQNHPHIKRMALELEGREQEAAALR
jgi:hypothetical protein